MPDAARKVEKPAKADRDSGPTPDEVNASVYRPDFTEQLYESPGPKARRGRPSALTVEARQAIIKAFEEGATQEEAAIDAGVDPRTLSNWLAKGKAAKIGARDGASDDYRRFFQEAVWAMRRGKRLLVRCAMRAGITDPKIAIKILERRYPSEWRLRIEVDETPAEQGESARAILSARLDAIEKRFRHSEGKSLPDSPAATLEREAGDADDAPEDRGKPV